MVGVANAQFTTIISTPMLRSPQDIDLAIYDTHVQWLKPFIMSDPNNVPNLDIDMVYPIRRLNSSSSPVAIGKSLLEGAGRGVLFRDSGYSQRRDA